MADLEGGSPAPDFFECYRREILHWNASMNLISRRDPRTICDGLLEQCRDAFNLFWPWLVAGDWVADEEALFYGDLGSGAGLPGVVWNQLFWEQGTQPRTVLVEPRGKRAWFLERIGKLNNAAPFEVARGRWGDVRDESASVLPARTAIISLKALFMKDLQILDGLAAFASGPVDLAGGFRDVILARFYPPSQQLDADLLAMLGPAPSETAGSELPHTPKLLRREILGPTKGLLPASLVVTHYVLPQV